MTIEARYRLSYPEETDNRDGVGSRHLDDTIRYTICCPRRTNLWWRPYSRRLRLIGILFLLAISNLSIWSNLTEIVDPGQWIRRASIANDNETENKRLVRGIVDNTHPMNDTSGKGDKSQQIYQNVEGNGNEENMVRPIDHPQNSHVEKDALLEKRNQRESVMVGNKGTNEADGPPKPRFILHLGPLKMGTTTIQSYLTRMTWDDNLLDTDGWRYLNEPYEYEDGANITTEIFDLDFDDPEFFTKFQQGTAKLRKFNKNLILVKEDYSVQFSYHPERFGMLYEILKDDWDVMIVAGYRPYYEWIASTWSQANKWDPFIYPDPHTWPWEHPYTGEVDDVQTIFPEHYSWISELEQFTDSMINFAAPYFPVKIMDLYDPRGLRTVLLCDILQAKKSCEKSMRLDQETSHAIENKGSLDEIHYDSIGVAAARRGLVDMQKWNRTDVLAAIQKKIKDDMQLSAIDLPMVCPDEITMNDFLEKSLRLDKYCVPELRVSDPNREIKLRQDFHKHLHELKTFCSVDREFILAQKEWKIFFQRFQQNDNNENNFINTQ